MSLAGLHAHDEYSLLDGAGTATQHAIAARDAGYVALANTNHCTLAGSLHHMRACREAGILAISGCEVYWRPNRKIQGQKEWLKDYNHLTLIAKDFNGWRSLMRIVSEAHRTGFYGRACIDNELLEKHHEGLICLTGCLAGKLARSITGEDPRQAEAWVRQLRRIFKDDLFVEIMPHDIDEQRVANVEAVRIADRHGIAVVATVDAHYPTAEWASTQDILLMIATNQSLKKREKKREAGEDVYEFSVDTLYQLSREQILDLFAAHHPDISHEVAVRSIDDTLAVASRIKPFLVDRSEKMPAVSFPGVDDNAAYLRRLAYDGLARRGYADNRAYKDQVDYELGVISKLESVDQILLAWDVVSWAKSDRSVPKRDKKTGQLIFDGQKEPMLIGPGRGSAAGSLVCWAIDLTNVNPIKHRLLFERFMNPDRTGKPDIDIDFSPTDVDLVESYVKSVHGKDRVVDVIAHSTFGPRAALSDVGRVLNVPYDHVKAATKTIDDQERGALRDIRVLNPAVDRLATEQPRMWEEACRVQGMVARKSEHAGALLILPGSYEEYIPVERTGGQKGKLLTAFGERGSVEHGALLTDYGFVGKLDLLRVAELTKQKKAVDLIRQSTGKIVDLDSLSVHDDPYDCESDVMDGFAEGWLVGIFQFSATAAKTTRQVKPKTIFDLSAINALIRPGPRGAGLDQVYARRKNGQEETTYWHPILEPILGFSYGVVAFQESLMEVVHKLGGLTLAQADIFRKIASKLYRNPEHAKAVMGKWEDKVKSGFASNGLGPDECDEVWTNTCESFSDYSFNLCVVGDTVVERGGAGGRGGQGPKITVKELYDAQQSKTAWGAKIRDPKRGIQLLQRDGDGRIRPGKMRRVIHNGYAEVFKVTTQSGKSITTTANHRLLTSYGYKPVSELFINDNLIVELARESYGNQYFTGRGRGHISGTTYEGRGFQNGEKNPGWIDGRKSLLERSRQVVRLRDKCNDCGRHCAEDDNEHSFEAAHVKTLQECEDNYTIFHDESNMVLLCNSCHKKLDYKKGERVSRWTRGRPSGEDPVISIESDGLQEVFDIEMATEEHNFVANGIVSHNSHAEGYSLLAYRDMWLKTHYPREFYAAFLSCGLSQVTKKRIIQKAEAVREARHMGLSIMPPDINESGRDYTVVEGGIRLGLESIKNIGPAACAAIEEHRPFESMSDVERRCPATAVNVTSRASLVMAGACDRWGMRDDYTEEFIDERERDLLGMSLTSVYSIAAYADAVEGRFWTEDEFDDASDGTRVAVVGEVSGVKEFVDKNGGTMCFVDLVYGPNHYNCTVFASLYEIYGDVIHSRRPLLVTGAKNTHKGKAGIRVESLPVIDDADFVPPICDLSTWIDMIADESEQLARDSVYPEDLAETLNTV